MATRSLIGLREADGQIVCVYCHWDGYPAHHAPILLTHYPTRADVTALLALGDLSALGIAIGEPHAFDGPAMSPDWCLAYGRDRGKSGTEARRVRSDRAYLRLADARDAEYLYLFQDGAWLIWHEDEGAWVSLAAQLAALQVPVAMPS